MAETFDDHDDVMELDHDDKERSKFRAGMKLVAAGFVATVVVVAAILFIVNRNGDSGNSSTADDSASGDDLVSEMEWTGKRADINGQMVYFPKDTKGQPLSTTVRDYSGDPGAAGSGTPSRTVFQTTDFSGGAPVPFSTQDGPTGFDGTVPVGYSQSAAGAALAAAAYFPQISPVRTTYEEFVKKATYRPTSDQLSRAAERVADDKDSRAPGEHGTIVGAAASMYSVPVFDTDYARVILYIPQKEGNTVAATIDLRWDDGNWKWETANAETIDETPQGVQSWAR